MRLLKCSSDDVFELVTVDDDDPPPYAILSHCWITKNKTESQEVTYDELIAGARKDKLGYDKIRFCSRRAAADGLEYSWIDTCCINKATIDELTAAINSMFRWYQRAAKCYVYLDDVSVPAETTDIETSCAWVDAFRCSRWFTRGWTLQELVAPAGVEFFSKEERWLGNRTTLEAEVHAITKLPVQVLRGQNLAEISMKERMSWAAERNTTLQEDKVYCLLGIFGVFLPLIYGEGEVNARLRLIEEYQKRQQGRGVERLHDLCVSSLLPFPRNQFFVGREDQLKHLEQSLLKPGGHRRMTIHGLGGSGKSALALEFGYLALVKDARRLVFWVPALSQDSFERAYRDIGTHLKVPGIKDGNADVLKLVKETLSSSSAGDWLMIIDNADDPGVVFGTQNGTSSVQLSECIPNSDRGVVLFTTRNRKVAEELTQSSVLEMNDMTRVEASQLLARRIQKEALLNDEVVVDKLLKTLTYLPLAIVQAVSFINNNSISISEYISLFDHTGTEAELLSQQFEDTSRYREVDSTIAKTWHISFNQLCKQDQLAAEYLSFIACIDRTNIPQSLLPRGKSLVQEVKALGTLIAYAFVTERQPPVQDPGRERCFDMHRLVHLASVGWLNEHGEWPLWTSRAVARLTELVPQGGYTQMNVWARYLSHAQHAAKPDGTLDESARLSLLDRVGRCQATLGRFTTAEKTHRYVLSSRRKTIGEGHSETLSSMHELGLALTYQSKHEEAEAIYRETLAIREAAPELGPMHPVTFISMNNLALVLERQGNLYEAETLNRETLARRESVLGPEHPDTLQSMCNLAGTLTYISKFYEAEQISRETLALRKKVLGPDHPATLMSMNNLAGVLDMMGHYKESEAINRETLARRKAVFGLEHPETLNSFYNVAGVLTKQGQYDEAEDLWRQGLAGQEAVLGPGHPDTLKSMYKLATVLDKQKKYEKSEALHRRTLEIRTLALGPIHHDTLRSMHWLGSTLNKLKRYTEAEPLLRQALLHRQANDNTDYLDELETIYVLADVLRAQRRYNEALPYYQTLAKSYYTIYGDKHQLTLAAHQDLAKTRLRLYEQEGAGQEVGDLSSVDGAQGVGGSFLEVPDGGGGSGKQEGKASKLAYAFGKLRFKRSRSSIRAERSK